jgi:hypothetical protein
MGQARRGGWHSRVRERAKRDGEVLDPASISHSAIRAERPFMRKLVSEMPVQSGKDR